MYGEKEARRDAFELKEEGYSNVAIVSFLHDLARSRDITWEECARIRAEVTTGGIETYR